MIKSCKYGLEWYDGSSREFLVENPFPRKTTYYGTMSSTKVKRAKRHNVQAYVMKSKVV